MNALHAIAGIGVALKNSRTVHRSAANAAYGVGEYLALPASILISAPFLVARLGLEQYGILTLANAIVGSVGVVGAGFGDATVKYVSAYSYQGKLDDVARIVRATIVINATLGAVLGLTIIAISRFAVERVFKLDPNLHHIALDVVRMSGFLLMIRCVEAVFSSVLRACESYASFAKLSIASRFSVVFAAMFVTKLGFGVIATMWTTIAISILTVVAQLATIRAVLGPIKLSPSIDRRSAGELVRFGAFSWAQALAAIVFSHVDRLLVAAMLGMTPLALYSIVVQTAQPIHGFVAAAFNFLFPHVSARHAAGEHHRIKQIVSVSVLLNVSLSLILAACVFFGSGTFLTLWMGADFAARSTLLLKIIALAFGLLALNVVPCYVLLALGRVRLVSILTIAGAVLTLTVSTALIPRVDLLGAVAGRYAYGALTLFLYIPMYRSLRSQRCGSLSTSVVAASSAS